MIIFFYGDETFRAGQKIKELKKKFLTKNTAGEGLVVLDLDDDVDARDVVSSIGAQNLFASKKLIVIKNFFVHTKADEQKKFKERIEKGVDDVVVMWETSVPRKNNALFKWLVQNADKAQAYAALEGAQLFNWSVKRLHTIDSHAQMSRGALDTLLASVQNDLYRINSELNKLASFAIGKKITEDMVRELVSAHIHADIFATIDAGAGSDKKTALTLLHKQLAKGDDPFYIFSMYVYQLRTLLQVGGFYYRGETDQRAIAQKARLHPFVVQKSIGALRTLSEERLKESYARLARFDHEIKTGQRDVLSALDLFVMKM